MTVSEEELGDADLVVFTGEAPQGTDNGGFGFEEEGISSPGPVITAAAGEPLTLVLQNVSEEFIPHDLIVVGKKDESAKPLWGAQTLTIDPGESTLVTFTPEAPGTYFYICSLLGHMSGHGMWGRFVVE
jgi:plastocyanin